MSGANPIGSGLRPTVVCRAGAGWQSGSWLEVSNKTGIVDDGAKGVSEDETEGQ